MFTTIFHIIGKKIMSLQSPKQVETLNPRDIPTVGKPHY